MDAAIEAKMPASKPRWEFDTAKAFLAFSALLTAAVTVLITLLIYQGYDDQFERTKSESEAASRVVAVHTQWLVEASFQVLERIQDQLADSPSLVPASILGDINSELAGLPEHMGIAVYGPSGNLRLANSGAADRANISGSDYFQELSGGETRTISSMMIDEDTGESKFVIARRLERQDVFSGVAAIVVENASLESVWRSLDLDPGSTISVIHQSGWLVARYPSAPAPQNLSDQALFIEHLSQSEAGSYLSESSPVDGAARSVSYRTIEEMPLIAVAALDTNATLARFWRSVAIVVLLIAPVGLTLIIAALWLNNIMKRDRATREALTVAVEKNQILFREIHHRVKNNLQAVSSLVQLQPLSREVKEEMGRRIAAMVAVHEHIYRTDQFESTDISDYVGKLTCDIVSGFASSPEVKTDLEQVVVHRDHVMPLGLILNEVLCNALKYAFKPGQEGKISVSLQKIDDETAVLRIADNGKGFDTDAASQGMGRRLIAGLVQQIDGEATTTVNGGTTFEVKFPTERSISK